MGDTAKLTVDGKTYELPILTGSEGERALDISNLRKETGLITLDKGYVNTGSCESSITFMDGERGILRYRGIPIEQLAEHSTFVETAYLLINGGLPTRKQLTRFSVMLNDHSLVHEDMRAFFENYPRRAHPMGILSSMVNALRAFYPELQEHSDQEEVRHNLCAAALQGADHGGHVLQDFPWSQGRIPSTRPDLPGQFSQHDV